MNSAKPVYNEGDHNFEILFADAFRKYESKLYSLALRLTRSDLYAKDIIQDVFLKLWEHRSEFHSIINMEAWLYRSTENKIIDLLRKAAADSRLRNALWNNTAGPVHEEESRITAKEYEQVIRKAIEQLPPQRKLIYHLNKEQGMTCSEIADKLSLSRNTVRNQLFTALKSLRGFFSKNIRQLFFL
jgi:RNA polymerase sigma-70 factor (family 1)